MSVGTNTTRVRPIRVAFLVDPTNAGDVYRAITLSTALWGGNYNTIIPAYRRMPWNWEVRRVRRKPLPADIVSGYLDGFDPDIVVPVGQCGKRTFQIGNRELGSEENLLADKSKGSTTHGIGFLEVMNGFWDRELKFKRTDDLHIAIAELPRPYRVFLASVFGALPPIVLQSIDRQFANVPSVTRIRPTLATLVEDWKPNRIYPRNLSAWGLEYRPLREPTLFVCDATSTLDVIDYWNLRATTSGTLREQLQTLPAAEVELISAEVADAVRPYFPNDRMDFPAAMMIASGRKP